MAKKDNDSKIEGDEISPAPVTLNAPPPDGHPESAGPSPWRRHWLAIAGLAISVPLLLAVVFLLPGLVSPVQPPEETESGREQAAGSEPSRAQGPTESPWRDAQFAKVRRETQEVLQQLLDKQEELEAIRVDLWASEDYQQVLGLMETADEHYQNQEFVRAQQLYREGLEQFEHMLERSKTVFASALEAGNRALTESDAGQASKQFQLAAHIDPNHEDVKQGQQRAAVLDDVLAKIEAGENLQRKDRLEEARDQYRAALALDGESQLAREHLREVEGAIADREFGRNMSEGFAAMADGKHDRAISAFRSALEIRPDAADARNALNQARNESTQSKLQALLTRAREHERQEQWQQALNLYNQALKVDKNLVEARVGSIRAGTRADIDKKLESILAAPERLTTPEVHREYQAFYEKTGSIKAPGPRLSRQLEELDKALNLAVQPVTVQLRSDNATRVTVYRVGTLGSFEQTEITLKPGTYTAVGTREGYRDVRQEFTVSATADRSPIVIRCEEKISQG